MAWIATLATVQMQEALIMLTVTFTEGVKSLTREFKFDVREKDLDFSKVVKQIEAVRTQLDQKTLLFQQLKAREGQQL